MTLYHFDNHNQLLDLQRKLLEARAESLIYRLEIARLESAKTILEIQVRKLIEKQNERKS